MYNFSTFVAYVVLTVGCKLFSTRNVRLGVIVVRLVGFRKLPPRARSHLAPLLDVYIYSGFHFDRPFPAEYSSNVLFTF